MKEERKGELFILSEAVLWALFPVLTVLSFAGTSPLVSLWWATFLAAFFFMAVMLYRGTWRELMNPVLWRYGVIISLCIGVGFYGLYYIGLSYTSPGNAALIALFEILTSYLLFNFIRKEQFPLEHKIGAVFMLAGAFIVLGKGYSGFALGDFLILAATFFAPVGNMYQQKARDIASSETVMFLRSAITSVILLNLVLVIGLDISVSGGEEIWPVLLVNGILIFGLSKMLWIEGIHRISVTKAILLQSTTPLLTLLFAWLLLAQGPTLWQVLSFVPFLIGILLLTGNFRIRGLPRPFWG